MVIGKLKQFVGNRLGGNSPDATAQKTNPTEENLKALQTTAETKAQQHAQTPAPATQLNIDHGEHLTSLEQFPEKISTQIAKFYEWGQDSKDIAQGAVQKTEAFLSKDGKQLSFTIPASVAAKKITNASIFKRLTRLFSKFKVNEALTRLNDKQEIDLISAENEITNSKLLQELTKAGVYSFVAVHKKDEKGNFNAKADLLIPVMNLHMMLEYLKKNPPKEIAKAMLENFKAEVENLENNSALKDIVFIDEALALKTNKAQFEDEQALRKALCNAVDTLSLNAEVFVASDLIGKGNQAQANGKFYDAINYNYPSISGSGEISSIEHPMTLVRRDENKDKQFPVNELATVLQWHFLTQVKTMKHTKDPQALEQGHKDNIAALKELNARHSNKVALNSKTQVPKNENNNALAA